MPILPHPDLLDEPEALRKPFAGALAFHFAIIGSMAWYAWAESRGREPWGDPKSFGGGGAVAISPVARINLPNRGGLENRLANDTKSVVPAPPKPEPVKPAPREDPNAIALKGRDSKTKQSKLTAKNYTPPGADRPNQVYSSSGAAASSDMFGSTSVGSGAIQSANSSPFGTRFGYYESQLRDKVARNWRTNEVDPRLQTAPPVIITFEILRDGSIRGVRVVQNSGNFALDRACQRAIFDSAPFLPLPAAFERNSAVIEFQFQYKR